MKGHILGFVVLTAIWVGCSLVDPQADHEVISPIITIDTTATGSDDSTIRPPGDDDVIVPDEGGEDSTSPPVGHEGGIALGEGQYADVGDYFPLAVGNYWVYDYYLNYTHGKYEGTYRLNVTAVSDLKVGPRTYQLYTIEGFFDGIVTVFMVPDSRPETWLQSYTLIPEKDGFKVPLFFRNPDKSSLPLHDYKLVGDTLRFGGLHVPFGTRADFVRGVGPVRLARSEKRGVLNYTEERLELRDYHIEGQ